MARASLEVAAAAAVDEPRVGAVDGTEHADGDHGEHEEDGGHEYEHAWQGLSAQIVVLFISIMEPDRSIWPGVELRHFAALQAVAEAGSFGRAAERLGYTPSAVRPQIPTPRRLAGQKPRDRP